MKKTVLIDTGGTKTRLCVFDGDKKLICEKNFRGFGAYDDTSLSELSAEIKDDPNIPRAEIERVVCNVGGKNDGCISQMLSELFYNARVEVFRESSGVIMRSLCLAEGADVILMAGTGSIALAIGEEGSIITDGWSPNSGDKGSGYWIGLESISRSLIALEGESLPPLAKRVTGRDLPFPPFIDTRAQMTERDKVREGIFPLERHKVAAYTLIASECARGGDEFAKKIFDDAGSLLAETVLRGILLARCKSPTKVFVSGGLVKCMDLWGDAFRKRLAADIEFSVSFGAPDMIKGAYYYAFNNDMR